MGSLAVRPTSPAQGLFLHHGHSRPIHLHIQDGDRRADDDRQIQLDGSLDLELFPLGDIASDGFRGALHRLGG